MSMRVDGGVESRSSAMSSRTAGAENSYTPHDLHAPASASVVLCISDLERLRRTARSRARPRLRVSSGKSPCLDCGGLVYDDVTLVIFVLSMSRLNEKGLERKGQIVLLSI